MSAANAPSEIAARITGQRLHRGPRLVSSITVEAVDELQLKEGSAATAIVKASDVMIAIED